MQLKEFFFKISFLYAFIPVKFLMKLAGKKIIFPFYHYVDNNEGNFVNHLYKPKTKSQFINDINFFTKHFKSLSLKDLNFEHYSNKDLGFLLSFDDGLSNFYKVVVPILLEEKIFAINFLNSSFIDNKDLFYRYKVNLIIDVLEQFNISKNQQKELCNLLKINNFNKNNIVKTLKGFTIHHTGLLNKIAVVLELSFSDFLISKTPYMSSNQIFELLGNGFLFGSHSKNHPRYSEINLENQFSQTLESMTFIKEKFKLEDSFFAFPFSDDKVSKEFFNKMIENKILTFGSSGLKDEDLKNHFQRIPMEYNSVYSAKTIIKGELIYYILKRFFGVHKTKRI